jgi:ribulose-phosphate 3-epimerase
MARERKLALEIEIDGGMNAERVPRAALAGIDVVIAGSAIFKAEDPAKVVRQMLSAVPV